MSYVLRVRTGLAVAGFLVSGIANAAVVGPEAFGYRAETEAPYTYEEISESGTEILSNVDDAVAMVPVGFSFPFYGAVYTDVYVSSNALMTFMSGNSDFSNEDLLVAGNPSQPTIAPLWDDWYTANNDSDAVFYETRGTPGDDLRLIVEWHLVSPCCGVPVEARFQAVLFEDGDIEFRYRDVTDLEGPDHGGEATVGIRAEQGTAVADGNVLEISYNAPNIDNHQAIRFSTGGLPAPAVEEEEESIIDLYGPQFTGQSGGGGGSIPGGTLLLLALAALRRRTRI
jgi:hypothetical protein